MVSRTYQTEEIKDNPHQIDAKKLYDHTNTQIMHVTLKPGQGMKPHKTPVDAVFYVLEGKPTIHIGEESTAFEKDTLIESPANIVHYISNESDQDARVLVIKTPHMA